MINLPSTTQFGKVVPKEKFYTKLSVSSAIKGMFVRYVEKIIWQNKLTADTMGVEKGENVVEIDVLEIVLKQRECPRELLDFIDKNLHHHNVFVLTYDGKSTLAANFKEKSNDQNLARFFRTSWIDDSEPLFNIAGNTLDAIYESIIRSADAENVFAVQSSENVIASPEGAWQSGQSLKDQIAQVKQDEKVKAQIEKLEKKLANEKQFNRQLEIRAEIKKLLR
ncbi:MAG: DUF4391 domain-containing protein [Fibrobacter sp.]|nr:DUF4391 domain-containing protein [Fibrobacter sp.]